MTKLGQIIVLMIGLVLVWGLATNGLEFINAPDWAWGAFSIIIGAIWFVWGNIIIFRKPRK